MEIEIKWKTIEENTNLEISGIRTTVESETQRAGTAGLRMEDSSPGRA